MNTNIIKTIHITAAADENYKKQLLAMIASAVVSADDKYKIVFHIAGDGFSEETISVYESFIRGKGHDIIWLHDVFQNIDIPLTFYFTRAASLRLFFADMIDDSIDTVIYLDADIVICENGIGKLAETDIGDSALGAVIDPDHDYECTLLRLGIEKSFRYFNSGVMIINLKKWREENASQKHIDILRQKWDKLLYVDQDVLNYCWMNDVFYLPLKFNVTSANYAFPAKYLEKSRGVPYYSIDEICEAIKNPYVIHYYGYRINRPWKKACYHPRIDDYIQAANLTPYKFSLEKTGFIERFRYTMINILGYREALVLRKYFSIITKIKKFFKKN